MKKQNPLLTAAFITSSLCAPLGAASYGNGSIEIYTNRPNIAAPNTYSTNYTVSTKTNAAVQAAIDNANSGGGGNAKLKTGTYTFSGAVTLKSNVRIDGTGMTKSIIKRNGNSTPSSGLLTAVNKNLTHTVYQQFGMAGNYTTSALQGGSPGNIQTYGLQVSASGTSNYNHYLRTYQLEIKRFKGGIVGGGGSRWRLENSNFNENGSDGSDSGLHHNYYTRRTHYNYTKDCQFNYAMRGSAYKMTGNTTNTAAESKDAIMHGNQFLQNQKNGTVITGWNRGLIEDGKNNSVLTSANNYNAGMQFAGTTTGCKNWDVINNQVRYNAKWGIYTVSTANNFHIEGNQCKNNDNNDYQLSGTNIDSDDNAN